MKDEGLSSVASSGWKGACRPYLAGVTELSPYLIKGAPRWLLLLFWQDRLWEVAEVPASPLSCDALEKTN